MVASTMSGQRRVASRLTAQEQEIINVSFDSFAEEVKVEEKDGSATTTRYIDTEKLREALNAVGDMTDIQLLIDDIDENGDGKIDLTEWTAIMSRKFLGEEDDSSFMHVFMMLDDNKDGYIPLVELRKMLMSEGQAPLSEQEVDELMMFADLDCDGLVNYRNFLRWLSAPDVYMKANQRKIMEKLIKDLYQASTEKNKASLDAKLEEAKKADQSDVDLQKAIAVAKNTLVQMSSAAKAGGPSGPPPGAKSGARASTGGPGSGATPAKAASIAPKAKPEMTKPFPTNDASAGGSDEETKIKQVMEVSHKNRDTAQAALKKAGGDAEQAIAALLD